MAFEGWSIYFEITLQTCAANFDMIVLIGGHATPSRHGLLRRCVSTARGRIVSDCGRICGIHQAQGVEANLLKGFQKKSYLVFC